MEPKGAKSQMSDRVGLVFFAVVMASIALLSVVRPVFNWDMIPYVALAEGRSGMFVNVTTQTWPALAVLLAACRWSLRGRRDRRWDQADGLFLALLLSLAMRCVIFPIPDDRLYLPTILLLSLLTIERWGEAFGAERIAEAAPKA